jgi:hypothetical protein
MYKRFIVTLILLWPNRAPAADPYRDDENAGSRAEALEALREKQAEAEDLQIEIERLRRLAGEPPLNVNVRVRLIEVSLTKLENVRGLGTPELPGDHEATVTDGLFATLIDKRIAKSKADEILTVADGCQARLHSGMEALPTRVAGDAENDRTFQGTEIGITPRWQTDGRLAIELVSKEARPIFLSGRDPQERVHEVTTMVELAPGKAIVLEGGKEQRVESSSRGILGVPALSRRTDTINEIQTFIVVSREPRIAARPVAAARVR